MTCSGCQAKVHSLLAKVPGVSSVTIDLPKGEAAITMDGHIATRTLQAALVDYPKYQLSEKEVMPPVITEEELRASWLKTYKPILLIFGFIFGITLVVEYMNETFLWERWMQHFMAGFFLTFSFFKLLDLRNFAESYATYDIVAKKWTGWGYVYAFIELTLGIAFLTGFNPLATNLVTFAVMAVSIIGVLQSVLNKKKIRCACLGAVFNLPMSTVTIIEDGLMIGMSLLMLFGMHQ
jgi:copper chaperone CopZ